MSRSPCFVIRQGVKWIGLRNADRAYVVGFHSAVVARHVQYNMHPEREPTLRRSHDGIVVVGGGPVLSPRAREESRRRLDKRDVDRQPLPKPLPRTVESNIFKQQLGRRTPGVSGGSGVLAPVVGDDEVIFMKAPLAATASMHDSNMHLATLSEEQLMVLPEERAVGLFMAHDMLDEDDTCMTLSGTIVEPTGRLPRVSVLKDLLRH